MRVEVSLSHHGSRDQRELTSRVQKAEEAMARMRLKRQQSMT
jgi:hypothetical protein